MKLKNCSWVASGRKVNKKLDSVIKWICLVSDRRTKLVIHMVDSLSVLSRVMDFQSAMETFAEAWVAANVTQVNIIGRNAFLIKVFCNVFVFKVSTQNKNVKMNKQQLSNALKDVNKQTDKRCCNSKIYLMSFLHLKWVIYDKTKNLESPKMQLRPYYRLALQRWQKSVATKKINRNPVGVP